MSSRGRVQTWWNRIFPEVTRHLIQLDRVGRYNEANNSWYAEGRRGKLSREEAIRRRTIVAKYNTVQRVMIGAQHRGETMTYRQARDSLDNAGFSMTDEDKAWEVMERMAKGIDFPDAERGMYEDIRAKITALMY